MTRPLAYVALFFVRWALPFFFSCVAAVLFPPALLLWVPYIVRRTRRTRA